uniref:Si:ch211-132e22.4 n=1 Tax=Nothobranchius furzeri TaxID=105023 RepID=A0A8C6M3E8_NOTFU
QKEIENNSTAFINIYTSECTNYCEGVPITNFQPCALHPGESKVPVHVIFLLVSDVISFFSCPRVTQDTQNNTILSSSGVDFLFYFGVVSNITLMVFIAQEHHLLVAYPKCHGCCTRIRLSPAVTFLAWAAPFAMLALAVPHYNFWFAVCFLAPFPFLLFLAVDSWRALHCSRSNPPTPERRRTAWGIGAIWANYTFLYSPFILSILPLVDPFLYIFMTKGPKEVLLVPPFGGQEPSVETVAESVETRL